MKYVFLPEALIELAPNKSFVIDGEYELKNVTWNKDVTASDIPTDESITKKCEELQADYDAKKYQRDRLEEYPSIQELVVALYDADDKAEIDKKRAEIKKKYPKPE